MINLRGRSEPEELIQEIKPIIDRSHLIGSCNMFNGPMCYQTGDKCNFCIRRSRTKKALETDPDFYKGRP